MTTALVKSRIGEKFNCVIKIAGDRIESDFDWLNGAEAGWWTENGKSYRIEGEIRSDNDYLVTDIECLDNGLDNKKG